MIEAELLERRDRGTEVTPATIQDAHGDLFITTLVQVAAAVRRLAVLTQRREQLGTTQFRLLMLLAETGGSRPAEAARSMGLSHCMVTEASAQLSRRQLIERARPDPSGPARLVLSAAGIAMAERLAAWREPMARASEAIAGHHKVAVVSAISQLMQGLEGHCQTNGEALSQLG